VKGVMGGLEGSGWGRGGGGGWWVGVCSMVRILKRKKQKVGVEPQSRSNHRGSRRKGVRGGPEKGQIPFHR